MPDGTIYAGISPNTQRPMYTTPEDAPLLEYKYTFDQANYHIAQVNKQGHQDWRMPWRDELKAMFRDRSAIGGLKAGGRDSYWTREVPATCYVPADARISPFGHEHVNRLSLRCVLG